MNMSGIKRLSRYTQLAIATTTAVIIESHSARTKPFHGIRPFKQLARYLTTVQRKDGEQIDQSPEDVHEQQSR